MSRLASTFLRKPKRRTSRMRAAGRALVAAGAIVVTTVGTGPARADDIAAFYKGRTVTINCGYSPGGTYDQIARLLAHHMPAHIPGRPLMIVKSMPGAGSLRAVHYLYEVSPRDGSELAVVTRSYPVEPILNPDKAKYSAPRFEPIGSTSPEIAVGVTWHTSRIKTLADLIAQGGTAGASGLTDDTGRYSLIVKNLTNANMKLVLGYPGGNEITLAVERGEIDARIGWSWGSIKSRSRAWLTEKKINVFVQLGMEKAPDLPNVPFLLDYAKSDTDRRALELLFAPLAAAWPLIAPPDVPKARVEALREAFVATMKDPGFLAAAASNAIEVEPLGGAAMARLNQRMIETPAAAVERARILSAAN